MNGFYIRKKAKENGIGKRVEGHFEPPALVLEDVINRGKSVMKAIDIIGKRYIAGAIGCRQYRQSTSDHWDNLRS